MADPHHARRGAARGDAVQQRLQHLRERDLAGGVEDLRQEGRAQADHDLAGRLCRERPGRVGVSVTRRRSSAAQRACPVRTSSRDRTLRMATIWLRRARRQAVAGAGAGIAVRVVDRADHPAAFDHGGGLQIVAGHPQPRHGGEVGGLAREAARGQRPDHVDHGQAAVAHRVVHGADLAQAEGLRCRPSRGRRRPRAAARSLGSASSSSSSTAAMAATARRRTAPARPRAHGAGRPRPDSRAAGRDNPRCPRR